MYRSEVRCGFAIAKISFCRTSLDLMLILCLLSSLKSGLATCRSDRALQHNNDTEPATLDYKNDIMVVNHVLGTEQPVLISRCQLRRIMAIW